MGVNSSKELVTPCSIRNRSDMKFVNDSRMLTVNTYDKNDIIKILESYSLDNEIKEKMIYVLAHDRFQDLLPQDMIDIYFVDHRHNDSLIFHIHNKLGTISDRVIIIEL